MSSSIPAQVLVIAIALFSVAASFAQPTPAEMAKAKAAALYAPKPAYPYEARSKHMTGIGIIVLNIDPSTGNVTSAQVLKSTGHKILDDSASEAFRRWRFKPGSARKVRIPINYTMQGFREWVRQKGHSQRLHNTLYWSLPEYPREARDKGVTGKGVAVVNVDPATGHVTSASMVKSTGHDTLDNAALRAFRQWRFRPRSITTLEISIQFTATGVFY